VDFNRFDEEKQLQIFRIIQEALTNVEKHSQAKKAFIIIRANPNGDISIGISDDGIGFECYDEKTREQDKLPALGIKGMTKRASLIGGTLTIRSEKGEGTLVCLEIPWK
jgi:signal transduction histidine kinase